MMQKRTVTYCTTGIELTRLTDDGIKAGISQKLVVIGKTVNVTDFAQDHSRLDIADTGDGHNDGVQGFNDFFDLGFVIINLSTAECRVLFRSVYAGPIRSCYGDNEERKCGPHAELFRGTLMRPKNPVGVKWGSERPKRRGNP